MLISAELIKIMLDNNNNKFAEFIIRKMIAHNKSTYEKTYSLIKEACQAEYNAIQKNKEKIIKEAYQNGVSLEELHVKFKTEEDVKRDVICCFKYDKQVYRYCLAVHIVRHFSSLARISAFLYLFPLNTS